MKWALAVAVAWIPAFAAQPAEPSPDRWFTNFTSHSFRRLAEAVKPMEGDRIDRALLDAAVFHETNRRRREHGLPELRFDAKVMRAARLHAEAMARHKFVGHENAFEPRLESMPDRARIAGLQPRFLAENVASAFGRHYESGEKFYVRSANGQTIYSHRPDGPQISMRTYVEAAEAVVEGWMNSPGHRKNILHKSPQYLGCACEPSPMERAMQKLYCVQVFYAPQR